MALSYEAMKSPRNRQSTASQGSLFLGFTTLRVTKVVVMCNPHFPCCLLWPLLFLTPSASAKRVWADCLYSSRLGSCKQPLDGPSLLFAREKRPISLNLSLSLEAPDHLGSPGLDPPWFLRNLLEVRVLTWYLRSGLASVRQRRDNIPELQSSAVCLLCSEMLAPVSAGFCPSPWALSSRAVPALPSLC